MKSMGRLTQEIIDAAIEGFESQKKRIDAQIAELRGLSNGNAPEHAAAPPKKRGMSAAGRKAIGEAQRKRWALAKGEAVVAQPAKKAKRKLSAAGRAAIIAATKKRWADKRAEAKK
jgi:hypothetical protein